VPAYDYRCASGHRFERTVAIAARDEQECPVCGEPSRKLVSAPAIGGLAGPGLAEDEMPQTWRGTHDGNPEYVGQLQKQWEARQKLEEKHPELKGDQRPILAHEGHFHGNPLRAGDLPPD
jgi:putative FmdB family regulatory protein